MKDRATATSRTARKLDRLTATGWVVLHDRRLVGTEETLDHVAIGPDGITAVQSISADGAPPVGVPVAESVHVARVRLHQLVPRIVEQVSVRLGEGWTALVYPVIAVNGSTPVVQESPQVYRYQDASAAIEHHPRSFSRMQVTDLVMSVESAFPFAPLGDEPR
ncbi:NERD domain-containing protein [Aeromicrobium sp. CF4.19]|uniref:NERD domain-containing protein n=1 Tax=Aeromicrobium sp. CF4.19 TaxID=3373082 RepID=UPI003EE5020D